MFVNEFYSQFSNNVYNVIPQLNMSVTELFPENIRDSLVEKLNQALNGIRQDFIASY
jgi:hypothetical protein